MSEVTMEALVARHERCRTRLDELSRLSERPLFWNRRYVFDFQWGNVGEPSDLQVTSLTLPQAKCERVIEEGTTFFLKGYDTSYEASGVMRDTVSVDPSIPTFPGTVVVSEASRPSIIDYTWKFYDEGGNRDLSNLFVPSAVLRSGNINGLMLGSAQARFTAGSKVIGTVNATYYGTTVYTLPMTSITNHKLQISLYGVAVNDAMLAECLASAKIVGVAT